MTLLHVVASPRKERSASLEVANAFIDVWKTRHPEDAVDVLNVWTTPLPEFDGASLEAKYAGIEGRERTAEQKAAWEEIERLAERFTAASVIVFSVPMWNFGIPYKLKHLIDVVSQKDVLFTFDANGLNGLLGGRTVVVAAARGVALGADYPEKDFDFQTAYLFTWAGMVGIKDFRSITVERTLGGPDADRDAREGAVREARELGKTLGGS